MRMTISGGLNGKSERERVKLIKQDWEAHGYKTKVSRQYNKAKYKRETVIEITK